MIVYIEYPKDSTKKLLELINELSKSAEYKIYLHTHTHTHTHTHINLLHYFTLNYEMLERESKNGILFQTESKKISFRNQTSGILGQNQTYRSTEQNREPRNKPRNLHSISLQKRRLKATMEKRQSFSK